MNTLQNFACAALLAANILTPATPQLIDFRLKGNRRHTTTRLQREARRAKIRKLVDAMSMPTIPIPDPPRPTPPPLTPVPFPSPGSPTDEPTATNSPSATQNAPTATPGKPTTRKPTKKPMGPTRKPTRKPTEKPMRPTRKPTRKPTNKPGSSTRSFDNCKLRDDDGRYYDEVTVERYDGKIFHFRWNETYGYGSCVDLNHSLYEFGEFDAVDSFVHCAQACLRDVDVKLTKSTVLRGVDYVCESEEDGRYYYEGKCRCLYERGTIESKSEAVEDSEFDETSEIGVGAGPVEGTSTEEELLAGRTLKTMCGAIHFDDPDKYEHFGEVAFG